MTVSKSWFVPALLVALALLVLLVAYGRWRWSGLTRDMTGQLEAARRLPAVTRFDPRELDALPPVVQRYFSSVLRAGAPVVTAASIEHAGSFNSGEQTDRWSPFGSSQRVVTMRPGFVWDARIAMLPGLAVHVHDAYVGGEGLLHATLLGLIPLADLRGGDAVAEGELMRYLAEAAWYPTALLPSQGVHWEAVDERRARATLADAGRSVTLTFTFDAQGLIESVQAAARGRSVGGRIVPTPWEGRWHDYQLRDGLQVPTSGEVAWLLPEGRKPYWRGTIRSIRYEFAR